MRIRMKQQLTMNKIATLLLAAGVSVAALAKNNVNIYPEETIGFNALDHVLQKPLGNDTFPAAQGLSQHFFVGVGGGIECIGDEFTGMGIKPGYRLSGELGYWFTPVHGLRLGADAGLHSVHKGVNRVWFGGLRAEYLVNFTTLLRGYDAQRKFELIGSVGFVGERVRQNGQWLGKAYGTTAAMQCRFNVQQSLYLYVEPRLTMLTGKRYDMPYDWRRTKVDLSLNVGLGYRILTGAERRMGSISMQEVDDDNLYFGCGVGMADMTRSRFPKSFFENHSPFGTAYVGKMLSTTSGIEASMDFGRIQAQDYSGRHFFATGTLSYVVNLNNAFGGYRPDQRFELLLNAGPSIAYTQGRKFGGASGGLTAVYKLSDNWGIFLRPQAGLYTREFAHMLGRRQSFLVSATMGLRYTIGDFSRVHRQSYEEYDSASKWFIQGSVGTTWRMRQQNGMGEMVAAAFGKRFTPVSSWRVGVEGSLYPRHPHIYAGVLTVDYLTSVSTAMAGYDPDRVFDLQGVVGVYAGVANYDGPVTSTYGLRGGLQGNFRVSSKVDLFVEPLFLASRVPAKHSGHSWVPELRVYAGVKYRFGAGTHSSEYKAAVDGKRNFVGVAAGPSIFSGSFKRDNYHITPTLDVMLGHWFSSVSGARLTYANDWIHRRGNKYHISSVHADYMLNITSIIDRQSERRLHLIGAVGVGAGFCKDSSSDCGLMTYGGLQLRYNLPGGLDIHLEPGMEFWANRIIPYATSSHRFGATGRVTGGFSLRF